MGSLASPPPPPPSPENSSVEYRVITAFCRREFSPDSNLCNWLESYDPSTNVWHLIGPIPGLMKHHALKGFAMVSIGDSIYIIGGRLCRKVVSKGSDEILEVDIEVRSTVLRYDVRQDTWSTCTSLGIPRFDFASTVCDNKIYVAGGQCALASARGTSLAEIYDPALDVWTSLPNMSTLRYKCAGVTWQGKIHVVGGFAGTEDGAGLDVRVRSSAEVFDIARGEWGIVGMWQLDVPPNQIVAIDGKLFSSGDCLNAWKGHIEAYNGKLNIWNIVDGSHRRTMSTSDVTEGDMTPNQRLYLTMAPIGTHLYFLAGYRIPGEDSRSKSVVHRFDTSVSHEAWTSFEPREEDGQKEQCSHCCVVKVS